MQSRTIKYILQKQKDATFSYITTTSSEGIVKEHHDKTDIENVLCKENQHKYQLAYQTPITQAPLKDNFGLDGLNKKA